MTPPRRRLWLNAPAALLATGLLGACASAVPGYIPPGEKQSDLAKLKSFESGAVADSGVYQPSQAERDLDCKRLLGSMKIIITRLKDQPNRPQPGFAAAAAQQTSQAVTGRPGISLTAEEQRERARLTAYNKLLGEKKCKTLDLEAELAAKPAPAPPAVTSKKP